MHAVDPLFVDPELIKPGNYKVLKAAKKVIWLAQVLNEDFVFPNWEKVIANDTPLYRGKFDTSDISEYYKSKAKLIREFPKFTILNDKNLKKLDLGNVWDVEWHGFDKQLIFTAGNFKSVFMPIIDPNYRAV
jgi:hypothetical protein